MMGECVQVRAVPPGQFIRAEDAFVPQVMFSVSKYAISTMKSQKVMWRLLPWNVVGALGHALFGEKVLNKS
jgi:hypothetical protein